MAGLNDDTFADKLLRFVLGALLGALVAWYRSATVAGIVAAAVIVGLLAVAFGNRFLEWLIRTGGRRW
jgi:hypothetical protein